jgi:triosephosphate isomerase
MREKILTALENLVERHQIHSLTGKDDQIQDRGSQVTLSAIGRNAPEAEKRKFDPSGEKRRAWIEEIRPQLGEDVDIHVGGVCVGETLTEREAGQMEKVLETQVQGSLAGLAKEQMAETVVAYEPVWAIGTGKTATAAQAQEVHAFIRRQLAKMFDEAVARKVRIQYGGSVKPANARELMSLPDVDGALVGGASLEVRSFADIVKNSI